MTHEHGNIKMPIEELLIMLAAFSDREHVKLKSIGLSEKDYDNLMDSLGSKICRLSTGEPIIYIDRQGNYMAIHKHGTTDEIAK